ncbi:hypothetical protein JBL43_10260 [Aureibaculum sp. A20]|uniref:Gliding motility lipoprotein GldB n=1 Tax=Aureibaculum flavum TaxID=2795986 RepID=A0ABS0WRL2_9FLAO|nr:hypothetical protein [Aureibaculum flavum]MBJ2174620.1 hypothetical protein [Aureibaculum flavum]
MKSIIYILIVTTLISCSTKKNIDLKSNNLISNNFNELEIKDLQLIFDFFINQICDSRKKNFKSLNECYLDYCSKIKEQAETNVEFKTKINFKQQLKLYNKIDNSTFKEIWSFHKSLPVGDRQDTLKFLEFNFDGNYIKFLNKFARENKAIGQYMYSYKQVRGLGPSLVANLIFNYKSFEIADIRTKVVIAIHYLTLNDQFHREEKYLE